MKKRSVLLTTLLAAVALVVVILAIDSPVDPSETFTSTQEAATSSTQVDTDTIEESTDVYTIFARYPTAGIGASRVEEYVKSQVSEFRMQAPETTDSETLNQHELEIEFEAYSRGGITSYLVSEYSYRGGVHGTQSPTTFVFNGAGEELSLSDVVTGENRDKLVQAVRQEVREVNSLSPDEKLPYELNFSSIQYFYLTENQLVIVFDQYAVAPGAAGVVQVELSARQYLENS